MTARSDQRKSGTPKDWLTHAESDLNLARLGHGSEQVLPQQICFHAQQAAEKALKAVLLSGRVDFPLTHDIEQLLEIAERAEIDLPPEVRDASQLTPYAVETRYPGSWQEVTDDDANAAIELAQHVIIWAKEICIHL